jgi:predicted Zn-dependent protease
MFKNIFVFLLFISIAFAGMAGDRNLSQLKSILRKLIAAVDTFPSSKKPVDIVIKEMNDINACAIPKCQNCSYKNNTIEVTSGLIDFLGMNENYLCYILAHELVHILLHQSVHQDTNRQVAKYFSRKAEKEADLTGLKIYLIA